MSFNKDNLKKSKTPTAEAMDRIIPVFNDKEPGTKTNNNENDNVNINNGEEHGPDYLDKLLEGPKMKQAKILTGLYLDPDVAKVLDNLGNKGGRGAKSRIANEALRKMFMEKDLL